MTIRLEQMHPAVVHFPIATLPLAVGADLLGSMTDNPSLRSFGRGAIAVAAAGTVAAVVTGLIAGEEVNVEGPARDKLMTHRNLNAVVTLAATCMAFWRASNDRPGAGYLTTGVAALGTLAYTAYLGGQLVYETGVGVGPAGGVYREDAPRLDPQEPGRFIEAAAEDLQAGIGHLIDEIGEGYLVPSIAGKQNPTG
ncbi:DUF2231 domain-containing protein [Paracoccus jeotgali]|uniref:DUF2231 domain-containing protein n=1 Tax=Paracoccus jeotgali TaxID=2065379 RepID=UPI0028ADAE1D|nr:DUF2231 domain-containing protein [Paracoccus jeotgali]